MSQPPLAVSLGDPAGVGPEIAVAAWRACAADGPRFFVVGDLPTVEAAATNGPPVPVVAINGPEDAEAVFAQALPVLPIPAAAAPTPGQPDPRNAAATIAWIEQATAFARAGQASGVVTNPIAKAVLYDAGFRFAGHTEFIAELTRSDPTPGPRGPVMMLVGGGLRVALVTIHEPLAQVPALLSQDRITHVARVVADALRRDFGVAAPRLALCGLNPHAGENGALGREEMEIITPAAQALRAEGMAIADPASADALFTEDARAGYDAAIAMYHDQGLIPVKTLDLHGGVNVTLGLPVVRTSPDHGTAFGIAGQGRARPDSLLAALDLAHAIAVQRAASAPVRA